ncbi:MAG: hypothetical protein EBZ62_09260, partial [Sphingobacteriia bacterium]|nr:hypothetical protein [Sphingobacteriia bacterium]
DSSGLGNNWTPNNLSVTAGAGNDSLVDVPTSSGTDLGAGGEVRGNYCTLNPLVKTAGQAVTLTNGNLDFAGTVANAYTNSLGTIAVSSGKWYVEYTVGTLGTSNGLGFVNAASLASVGSGWGIGEVVDGWLRTGTYVSNNSSTAISGLTAIAANDVVMLALDINAGKAWWGRNGTWENSGDPATGANAMITFTPGGKSFLVGPSGYSASVSITGTINYGSRPFAYTAPSGFKALCTTNLPAPLVTKPNTVMDVKLYTGNGSTQTISGLGFSPDLIWTKSRSQAYSHNIYDIVRGVSKNLFVNETSAENTDANTIKAFNSDGFQLGSNDNGNYTNGGSAVAWCWDAGSSTVTNTQGSITSTVRANATAGFA